MQVQMKRSEAEEISNKIYTPTSGKRCPFSNFEPEGKILSKEKILSEDEWKSSTKLGNPESDWVKAGLMAYLFIIAKNTSDIKGDNVFPVFFRFEKEAKKKVKKKRNCRPDKGIIKFLLQDNLIELKQKNDANDSYFHLTEKGKEEYKNLKNEYEQKLKTSDSEQS